MPYFTTRDGGRLHYQLSGEESESGDAPALIFVHGWCSNLTHWARQVPAFSRRHAVLRLDRRGHGRSDAYEGDWSPRDHADDIAELAHSLGIRDAVAIGHAGGGPSAHELTGRYPELVRAMVLVDDGLRRGVRKAEAAASPFVQRLEQPDYLDVFVPQYRTYFHPMSGAALADRCAAEAARTPQHVILNEIRHILRANTIAMAKRVKQPVLWMVSSGSRQTAERVREHLPQAQFAQLVQAGHFLHLECPEQFNPMLRRFLDSLEGSLERRG